MPAIFRPYKVSASLEDYVTFRLRAELVSVSSSSSVWAKLISVPLIAVVPFDEALTLSPAWPVAGARVKSPV